jgi:hypothetical protein
MTTERGVLFGLILSTGDKAMSTNQAIKNEMKEYKVIREAVKQCRQAKNIGKKELLPQREFFNVALKFSPLTPSVNGKNWVEADWKKHHANYAKSIRAKIEALPANASAAEIEAVIVGSVLASANLTYQVVRNYLSRKRYVVQSQPPHDFEAVDCGVGGVCARARGGLCELSR